MKRIQSFKLSHQGRIASAVSMALIFPLVSVSAMADNIRPIGDTTVTQVGDVDVVNIANPNANGLSHNQYKDFNVGKAGAVLNNAMTSGQSQLAGQLEGNSQLKDTASVILNEVVTKNPSLLLGQQEVFGMAADYVLANPNGITCEDCGFINTNRASLVVGTPNIAEERLAGFNVGHRQSNTLTVKGDVDGEQRLDLLAPKVDINGKITTSDAINVISGRNQIDYDTLQVSALEGHQPNITLDGQILGSMQSGRIRLHNTDKEATQTIQGQFDASTAFDATADHLKVVDSDIKGGDVSLRGDTNLYVGGQVVTARDDAPETKEALDEGVTLTNTGYNETQSYTGSSVSGNRVDVSGGDVAISGSQLQGDSINAQAQNVTIDGVTTTDTTSQIARNSKGLWFNENEALDKTQQYHQSSLKATDGITLASNNDLAVSGANIEGGNIALEAGNALTVNAGNTENSQSQINRYKHETEALKSGAHTLTEATQASHQTHVKGDSVSFISEGEQNLEGLQASAKTVTAHSGKDLTVLGSVVSNRQTDEEDFKYWGGIGGGETHIDNQLQNRLISTQIKADDVSLSSDANLNVAASEITASNQLDMNAEGDLNVAHDFATEQAYSEDRHGTAFNITDKKQVSDRVAQSTINTSLDAKNLSLTGDNVTILGTDLNADETVVATAQSKLTTGIANATDITKTETYDIENNSESQLNIDLSQGLAGALDTDSTLFEASGSLAGVTTLTTKGTGQSRGNTVTAANAEFKADTIALNSSDINTVQQVNVDGREVVIGADEALTAVDSKVTKSTGPEAYIRGGKTGVDVGVSFGTDQIINEHNEYQAVDSHIKAGDDVTIQADESLTNQGTHYDAAQVDLTAADINNEASYDRIVDRDVVAGGDAALQAFAGVNPIAGGNLTLSGQGIGKTTEAKTAHVADIKATDAVTITAENKASDAGTNIHAKSIAINAGEYDGNAAYDSTVTTTHSGSGDVNVNANTSNLVDVTVGIGGRGNYQYLQTGEASAIKGNLTADKVAINADTTATAAQNVTADSYTLNAGTEARIAQDADKQWTTAGGAELGGDVGFTVIPATAATGVVIGTPSFSGKAGFNYLTVEDSQAKAANVKADTLSVTADNLAQVDGAKVDAHTVIIKGDRAVIAAAQDNHRAIGVNMGGQGAFSLSLADNAVSSNDIGAGSSLGVINETSNKAHAATIDTDKLSLTADAEGNGLVVEGANINANDILLTNNNEQGDVAVTAATSKDKVSNFGIGGNLSATASTVTTEDDINSGSSTDFDTKAIGAQLNVNSDDSEYYTLGSIKADNMTVNSGNDVNLQSHVDANKLTTTAGNDLNISSAQDVVRKVDVDTSLAVDGSPITFAERIVQGDVLNALTDDFNNGTVLGVSATGNASVNIDHQQQTHQANVNAKTFNANVGSQNISVNAANVSATNTDIGDATVNSSNTDDFVHTVGASVDAKTFSIPDLVSDAFAGNTIEKPVNVDINYDWNDNDGENTKAKVNF